MSQARGRGGAVVRLAVFDEFDTVTGASHMSDHHLGAINARDALYHLGVRDPFDVT